MTLIDNFCRRYSALMLLLQNKTTRLCYQTFTGFAAVSYDSAPLLLAHSETCQF